MDKEERLRRAEEHIFSTGVEDSGAGLGLLNMRYGLAKVHWVQERFGMPPDATFVSAPDVTVTRNEARWKSGFGYGGTLTWGDGSRDLVVLDVKPNACGMIVGGLERLPDRFELLERVHALREAAVEIDGIPAAWDFGESNHFIDICRVEPEQGEDLPPWVFLMHFAGDELRGETSQGPGLYWDRSPALRDRMEVHDTPFGPLRTLRGEAAREYLDFYRRVERFVQDRRRIAADRLFDDYTLINNDTHQGFVHMNRVVLGCYRFDDTRRLYPLGLRPDVPAYLMRGRPNLGPAAMKALDFEERARRLGVEDQVRGAHILPHGGGYVFPDFEEVTGVHELNGDRYFEVKPTTGQGRQILDQVRHLPFEYRDGSVLRRTLDLEMAEVAARLVPEFVLKV